MKFISALFIVLFLINSHNARASDVVTDSAFIHSAIRDLFPAIAKDAIYLKGRGNMHTGLSFRPSEIRRMRSAKIFLTLNSSNAKEIKNSVYFGACEALPHDLHCQKDGHFWMTPGAVADIYGKLFDIFKNIASTKEIDFAKKVLKEVSAINTKLPCEPRLDIYTSHGFSARISDYTRVSGEIFSDHGDIKPSKIKILKNKAICILSDGELESVKLHFNTGTKISQIDADGEFFENEPLAQGLCLSSYCTYINKLKDSICMCS